MSYFTDEEAKRIAEKLAEIWLNYSPKQRKRIEEAVTAPSGTREP